MLLKYKKMVDDFIVKNSTNVGKLDNYISDHTTKSFSQNKNYFRYSDFLKNRVFLKISKTYN